MFAKLAGLIVDSNIERRGQLKYMLRLLPEFPTIHVVATYKEAIEKLKDPENPIDVLFLGNEGSRQGVLSFLEELKPITQVKALLIMMNMRKGSPIETEDDAKLCGAHGVLFEPLSAEALQIKAREAATQVERLREERQKEAVLSVLKNSVQLIDKIVGNLRVGESPGDLWLEFKKECRTVRHLEGGILEYYYESMVELFEAAKPMAEIIIPENATLREKRAIRKKLYKRYEFKPSSTESEGQISCHGDLGSQEAAEYFTIEIEKLRDKGLQHIRVDLSEAENVGKEFVKELLNYTVELKKKGGALFVEGDRGLMKEAIQKIKQMKLAAKANTGEPPEPTPNA